MKHLRAEHRTKRTSLVGGDHEDKCIRRQKNSTGISGIHATIHRQYNADTKIQLPLFLVLAFYRLVYNASPDRSVARTYSRTNLHYHQRNVGAHYIC